MANKIPLLLHMHTQKCLHTPAAVDSSEKKSFQTPSNFDNFKYHHYKYADLFFFLVFQNVWLHQKDTNKFNIANIKKYCAGSECVSGVRVSLLKQLF